MYRHTFNDSQTCTQRRLRLSSSCRYTIPYHGACERRNSSTLLGPCQFYRESMILRVATWHKSRYIEGLRRASWFVLLCEFGEVTKRLNNNLIIKTCFEARPVDRATDVSKQHHPPLELGSCTGLPSPSAGKVCEARNAVSILAHVAQSCCTQGARMPKSRSSACMWSARRERCVASSLNV